MAAEVSAALQISRGAAACQIDHAVTLRDRLPKVAEVFASGAIDYRRMATIVYRTGLIADADALATVDARLAMWVPRWPAMTAPKLADRVDRLVAAVDPDAVCRARESARDRFVDVDAVDAGLSEITGRVFPHRLAMPVGTAPEPCYRPSQALADFVRCRDLTCRFPGCDQLAVVCDVDHTIAYPDRPIRQISHVANIPSYLALARR